VIRGLIQQQEIGLHDEQTRQVRAHHPAAAHLARRSIEIGLPKPEARQNRHRFGRYLWIVQSIVLGVRFEIFGCRCRTGLFQFGKLMFQFVEIRSAYRHLENGFLADCFAFLGQVTDHRPIVALYRAFVRHLFFQDD